MANNTAFNLGVYVANPNGNDAASEKYFEGKYDGFVKDMGGAHPTFFNQFVDFGQDPSTWASSASWNAWSANQSGANYVGSASGATPVVGVPLASNAGGWGNVDTFYKDIIAGKYDSAYKGIVDAYADQGYKTVEFRNSWEFNGNFMPWAPGNSGNPNAVSDFVKAFQHVADIEHSESKAKGIIGQVEWNTTNQNWTPYDLTTAYPGDSYVDIISTDAYSPVYPNDLTDWAHGGNSQVSDAKTWAADAANREHFWQYNNGSQWNPTPGLGGSGWSMQNAIDFAKQHGKALAIDESGAGPSGESPGPSDDPAFVKWLHDSLSTAQSQGVVIDHVNIWDTTLGDGDWDFSNGSKPLEQAAYGKYFGAGSTSSAATSAAPSKAPTPAPTPATTPATTPGSDTLTLALSQDFYKDSAQFTVSVDGKAMGGTMTAHALHGSGANDLVTLTGNWGSGSHDVKIAFINDAWGGTATTDRNLFVDGAYFNGKASGASHAFMSAESQNFAVNETATGKTPGNPLTVHLSEDAYKGDAKFILSVDGKALTPEQTVTALHSAGKTMDLSFAGLGSGSHDVGVTFTNDAWDGTPVTDRNMYVTGIDFAGKTNAGGILYSAGTQHFAVG